MNLPIGALTALAARRLIRPECGSGLRGGADVLGVVLITGAMMHGVFTIVDPAAQRGWPGRAAAISAVAHSASKPLSLWPTATIGSLRWATAPVQV